MSLTSNNLKWKLLSCVRLLATPQAILSTEFSRPEYWSGEDFPSPRDLPIPGIEPRSPALQADSLPAEPKGKPTLWQYCYCFDNCSLVVGFEIWKLESSSFVVLFQDCLAIRGPLRFYMNFRMDFLLLQKSHWDFYRDFFCRLLWVTLTF